VDLDAAATTPRTEDKTTNSDNDLDSDNDRSRGKVVPKRSSVSHVTVVPVSDPASVDSNVIPLSRTLDGPRCGMFLLAKIGSARSFREAWMTAVRIPVARNFSIT
jgi:hypothetical protein